MAEDKQEVSAVRQIINHAIDSKPSEIKNILNQELHQRAMNRIEDKKREIGSDIFSQ